MSSTTGEKVHEFFNIHQYILKILCLYSSCAAMISRNFYLIIKKIVFSQGPAENKCLDNNIAYIPFYLPSLKNS